MCWLFLKGCAIILYLFLKLEIYTGGIMACLVFCVWNWYKVWRKNKKTSELTIKIVCTFFYENSKGPDWLLGMYETPSISEVYALSICHEKNTSQRQNLRLHPFSILYSLFSSKVGLLKVPLMLNLGLVRIIFYSILQRT